MKPKLVKIRLRGHWFCYRYVHQVEDKWVAWTTEDNAKLFPRAVAAALIQRVKSWGKYYHCESV